MCQVSTHSHLIGNAHNFVVNGHGFHHGLGQGVFIFPLIKTVCQVLNDSHVVKLTDILRKSPDQVRYVAACCRCQNFFMKHVICEVCLIYFNSGLFLKLLDLLRTRDLCIRAVCPAGPKFHNSLLVLAVSFGG